MYLSVGILLRRRHLLDKLARRLQSLLSSRELELVRCLTLGKDFGILKLVLTILVLIRLELIGSLLSLALGMVLGGPILVYSGLPTLLGQSECSIELCSATHVSVGIES